MEDDDDDDDDDNDDEDVLTLSSSVSARGHYTVLYTNVSAQQCQYAREWQYSQRAVVYHPASLATKEYQEHFHGVKYRMSCVHSKNRKRKIRRRAKTARKRRNEGTSKRNKRALKGAGRVHRGQSEG